MYPSAAAAVGVADRVLAQAACGRISLPGGPLTTLETRYDMASLTKIMVTTILALQAMEENKLSLDERLGDFFSGVPVDKAWVSIFHLMTHTGKLPAHFLIEQQCAHPSQALSVILNRPQEDIADGTPCYSCAGYILLGWILEKRCAKPLDILAQERIFDPLGMTHTGFRPQGGNIAATEVDPISHMPWQGVVHDENARFLGGVAGNAGLFSDVADTGRFASALACGGKGILRPQTLALARRNHTPGQAMLRGLGFHLAGGALSDNFAGALVPRTAYGHTGFTGTSILVDPETGFYAVLLTNRIHPSRDNDPFLYFRGRFHDALYAAREEILA